MADIDEAQRFVHNLIRIRVPLIQNFDGFLKILNPDLQLSKKIMALAFQKAEEGIRFDDLLAWLGPRHRSSNVKVAIKRLVNEKAFLHIPEKEEIYYITEAGIRWVEENIDFNL